MDANEARQYILNEGRNFRFPLWSLGIGRKDNTSYLNELDESANGDLSSSESKLFSVKVDERLTVMENLDVFSMPGQSNSNGRFEDTSKMKGKRCVDGVKIRMKKRNCEKLHNCPIKSEKRLGRNFAQREAIKNAERVGNSHQYYCDNVSGAIDVDVSSHFLGLRLSLNDVYQNWKNHDAVIAEGWTDSSSKFSAEKLPKFINLHVAEPNLFWDKGALSFDSKLGDSHWDNDFLFRDQPRNLNILGPMDSGTMSGTNSLQEINLPFNYRFGMGWADIIDVKRTGGHLDKKGKFIRFEKVE